MDFLMLKAPTLSFQGLRTPQDTTSQLSMHTHIPIEHVGGGADGHKMYKCGESHIHVQQKVFHYFIRITFGGGGLSTGGLSGTKCESTPTVSAIPPTVTER